MSEEQGSPPKEFQPIEDKKEQENLLKEGAKAFASAMIWTKNQDSVVRTHLNLYSQDEKVIYTWLPKEFDIRKFEASLSKNGTRECFFSVSLPWANIFFKAGFLDLDAGGLRFKAPEKVYKVQRRKDIRFRIPEGVSIKVDFLDPLGSGKSTTRKVYDLSASGLAFLAEPGEEAVFVPGMVLKDLTLNVRQRKMTTAGEVRHCQQIEVHKKPVFKVGILFKDMRAGDSQHIAGYVFEESRKYFLKFI